MNKLRNGKLLMKDQDAKEKRQVEVAKLMREGKVYREIRDILGISLGTIKNDVEDIIGEWRTLQAEEYNEHVTAELYRLLQIDEQAAEQWEESKTRKRTKTTAHGAGENMMITTEVITSVPDPKYLDIRADISTKICRLLGLEKPIKIAQTDPSGDYEYRDITEIRQEVKGRLDRLLAGLNYSENGDRNGRSAQLGTGDKK